MILELAHNISVIWPNQLQNRAQRNAHARVYTNKICSVINQWNCGWAKRHMSPRPAPPQSSRLHSGVLGFLKKDCLVKCLAMSLLIVELINHVNNFTALVVNFTDTVVGSLCENI